jgi:hypothetical protein
MERFMRSSSYFKTISRILILAMLHLCWLTSYGYAETIPTESAVQPQIQDDRQRLLDLLDRQDVVEELEKYGISTVEAVARINSLTDEEVTMIAGKLDELEAGGFIEGLGAEFAMEKVCRTGEPGLDRLIGCFLVNLVASLILLPFYILLCPFSDKSYFKCVGNGFQVIERSKKDLDVILMSKCRSECDSQYNTCKNSFDSNFQEHHPQAEEDCIWQFDSCMQWAGNPQQVEQCHENKQMCVQEWLAPNSNEMFISPPISDNSARQSFVLKCKNKWSVCLETCKESQLNKDREGFCLKWETNYYVPCEDLQSGEEGEEKLSEKVEEELDPVPAEEDCDPGMESCL